MKRSANDRAATPFQLPESLHYLTPPPFWRVGSVDHARELGTAHEGCAPETAVAVATPSCTPVPDRQPDTVPVVAEIEARPKPRLLTLVRDAIRVRHYSPRTESAYVRWIKQFIFFHGKRHPNELGASEVKQFLCHLATHEKVAASTQNQAFSAVLFL